MAILNQALTPLVPATDPTTQRIAALEARVAALEAVLQIQSTGDVKLKVVSALILDAATVTITAASAIACKAGAGLTLDSGTNVAIKASALGTLQSGSTMTIKGAMVNIN